MSELRPEPNAPLGEPADAHEKELLELYQRLQNLTREPELAPCVQANCAQALVLLWNACNDLGLVASEPDGA